MSTSTINNLSKLTVVVLRERLKEHKLNAKGKKQELVERLAAFLDDKNKTESEAVAPEKSPEDTSPPPSSVVTNKENKETTKATEETTSTTVATNSHDQLSDVEEKSSPNEEVKKQATPTSSPTKKSTETSKSPVKNTSPVKSASPTKSSTSNKEDEMEVVVKQEPKKEKEIKMDEIKEEKELTVERSPSKVDVDFEGDSAVKDLMETSDDEGRKKRKRSDSPEGSDESRGSKSMKNSQSESSPSAYRVVPKSTVPATDTLLIKGFVRPFRIEHVQELLGKTGTIQNFWMDDIRTHCYVTFQSKEQAAATRDAVYDLAWPAHSSKRLIAEFSTHDELNRASRRGIGPKQSGQNHQTNPQTHSNKQTTTTTEKKKEEAQPGLTLDSLFRKTKAKPCIYYLPLTEKEIEEKKNLEALKNSKPQTDGSASTTGDRR